MTVLPVEYSFVNARGQRLHAVHYVPPGRQQASLVWHHGYAEHVGRYKPVFRMLAQRGISVFAYDAHGHGRSEPEERCLVNRFSDLVDDMELFASQVFAGPEHSGLIFAGGHSMGGLVAASLVLRRQHIWAGLLLHSAAVDVEWTPVRRVQSRVAALLAGLVPRWRLVAAVAPEHLHQDPAEVRAYLEDPLVFNGPVRARTAYELLQGFRMLQSGSPALSLPLYAAHGDNDRVTSLPAVRLLLARAASRDKVLHVLPGGMHELLIGGTAHDCAEQMAAWMLARIQRPRL